MKHGTDVTLVGAGPTGALLAILLRRAGHAVTLYEGRADPRGSAAEQGRSINLAMADRGIHALKLAGVYDEIAATLMPMRGRQIHQPDGSQSLQLYGQRSSEVIYSVSRHRLSSALLEVAERRHGATIHFEHRLETADFAGRTMQIRDVRRGTLSRVTMGPTLAADGAGSAMRRAMSGAGLVTVEENILGHGYKELSIPPLPGGGYAMAPDALHIWPRGEFMLIALPNTDGSFTATLFLAKHGDPGFEALCTPTSIAGFMSRHFPDVYPLMPDLVAEFRAHPLGMLGTVYANPWHAQGNALLVGDAAHAIVPFHGQGMNCCFEDCVQFADSLARHTEWEAVFEDFNLARKPNTDAIAAMALENYREMRERVVDPTFRLQQLLALELERRHPGRFIPRYSMVTFHHEIPYLTALERGRIQTDLLVELTSRVDALEGIDYERAAREIEARLPPLDQARSRVMKL